MQRIMAVFLGRDGTESVICLASAAWGRWLRGRFTSLAFGGLVVSANLSQVLTPLPGGNS